MSEGSIRLAKLMAEGEAERVRGLDGRRGLPCGECMGDTEDETSLEK